MTTRKAFGLQKKRLLTIGSSRVKISIGSAIALRGGRGCQTGLELFRLARSFLSVAA